MLFPIRRAGAIAALLLIALLAATATAMPAGTPAPGCSGMTTDDPAGDVVGGGGDNYDVKGVFFTFEGSRLNVNLQIADLSPAVSKPGLNARWIVIYRVADTFYYVRMWSNGTDVDYRYGTYDPTLDDFTGVADVKGAMVQGKDGVITLEIPKAAGGKAGAKITELFVSVRETAETGAPANQVAYAPESDRAPDSGSAKEYVVTACAGGASPPPVTAPAPPAAPPVATAPAQLGIKAPASGGSAAKASKRKRLAIKLTGTQPVTALKAELLKGNKVLGTGTLARLDGTGTVAIKVKRKLAKGSYGLRLTGTVADGRTAQAISKLKLTK
jgi:hypothetical protein